MASNIFSPAQNIPGDVEPKHFRKSAANCPNAGLFKVLAEVSILFVIWNTSPITAVKGEKPANVIAALSLQQRSDTKHGRFSPVVLFMPPNFSKRSRISFVCGTLSTAPVPAVHMKEIT